MPGPLGRQPVRAASASQPTRGSVVQALPHPGTATTHPDSPRPGPAPRCRPGRRAVARTGRRACRRESRSPRPSRPLQRMDPQPEGVVLFGCDHLILDVVEANDPLRIIGTQASSPWLSWADAADHLVGLARAGCPASSSTRRGSAPMPSAAVIPCKAAWDSDEMSEKTSARGRPPRGRRSRKPTAAPRPRPAGTAPEIDGSDRSPLLSLGRLQAAAFRTPVCMTVRGGPALARRDCHGPAGLRWCLRTRSVRFSLRAPVARLPSGGASAEPRASWAPRAHPLGRSACTETESRS